MREIDAFAHGGRWRDRTVETMVLTAGLLACALGRPSVAGSLLVCAVVAACLLRAGVPLPAFLRAARVPMAFLAVGALPLCVSVGLHRGLPSFSFSSEGATTALGTAARSMAALSATLLLAFTTPFPCAARVLRDLRLPTVVVELAGLVYRSIFLLDEAFRSSRTALAARHGFRDRAATLRSSRFLATAMLARSFRRSSRQAQALECRGGADVLEVLLPPLRPDALRLAGALILPALLAFVSWRLEGFHAP